MNLNDKTYILDIDNVMNFIFESSSNRTNDSEITETYVADEESGELTLINKQLREIKGSENSSKDTIRYDMLKMFMEILNSIEINEEISPMSFGERIILNTMISENLLKEID